MRPDRTTDAVDGAERFELASEPAHVWNRRSVAKRLCCSPLGLTYWLGRPDFPKPILVRDSKQYWNPAHVNGFCERLGM